MRKLLAALALLLALPAVAHAGTAPVLSVNGETLNWTGGTHAFVVERKPGPTFTTVEGRSYKPPADPGTTDTFRVRPKSSPKRWSNEVSISYPKEEEPPKGEEPPTEEPPPSNEAGRVRYRLNAASYYDSFADNTAFLKAHISRSLGYGAFAWSHYVSVVPTVCYRDAYTHWGSFGLTSAHIAEYEAEVRADREHGCIGPFNDDIEFVSGQHQAGTPQQVAELVEASRRAAGPSATVETNIQYADLWPRIKEGNPYAERVLKVISQNDKEFGVEPNSGINSPSAFAEYLAYVDYLHGRTPPIHIDQSDSKAGDMYELCTYLLINTGQDFTGSHTTPSEWWSGYDTNLGAATGPREHIGTAYRRKFVGGVAYVNPPGAPSASIDGHTLAARSGLIAG